MPSFKAQNRLNNSFNQKGLGNWHWHDWHHKGFLGCRWMILRVATVTAVVGLQIENTKVWPFTGSWFFLPFTSVSLSGASRVTLLIFSELYAQLCSLGQSKLNISTWQDYVACYLFHSKLPNCLLSGGECWRCCPVRVLFGCLRERGQVHQNQRSCSHPSCTGWAFGIWRLRKSLHGRTNGSRSVSFYPFS